MNIDNIRKFLTEYDQTEVGIFLNYLQQLEKETKDNAPKNPWVRNVTDQAFIDVYKKVAKDGVFIDGESITLGWRGSLQVTYDFQAYKNLVIHIYPETMFDLQLVHEGDDFSFHKETGKIIYSHKINDPFAKGKKIIGAYCIIKNSRGEFLETINMDEVAKMKSVAKTQSIWNVWEGEMIMKSIIKRSCKRHFNDIVENAEKLDNENNDLDRAGFDAMIQGKIEKCNTFQELTKLYNEENKNITDQVMFLKLLGERKAELMDKLPAFTETDRPVAVQMLKEGKKLDQLRQMWKFTPEQLEIISKEV
jgi:hypothetical protein